MTDEMRGAVLALIAAVGFVISALLWFVAAVLNHSLPFVALGVMFACLAFAQVGLARAWRDMNN